MPSSFLTSVAELQQELQRIVGRGQGHRATNDAVRQWTEQGDLEHAVALWFARREAAHRGEVEFRRFTLAAWTHLDHSALAGELLRREPELGNIGQGISELLERGHRPVLALLAAFARARPNDHHRLIRYAATMLSGYPHNEHELDPLLGRLTELLESRDPTIRLSVVHAVPIHGGPAYLDASLCGLLRDSVPKIRIAVAHLLGRRRSEQAIDALAASLAVDSERIARVAAWSLGTIECADAVEALYRSMHVRPQLRREIALALVRTGDLEAVPALVRGWLTDVPSADAAREHARPTPPRSPDRTQRAVEELAKRVLLEHEPAEVDRLLDGLEPDAAAVIRKLVPAWSPGIGRVKMSPDVRRELLKIQPAMECEQDEPGTSTERQRAVKWAKARHLGRGTLSTSQMKLLDCVFLPKGFIHRESVRWPRQVARSCLFCGRPPEHLRWVWCSSSADIRGHSCGDAGWMTLCDDCQCRVSLLRYLVF